MVLHDQHVWTAYSTNKTKNDTQCPYCCIRLVCLHNFLATVTPDDVLQYWNHSKNEQAPQQVLAGSNFRADWNCPSCNWEWQARIARFVNTKPDCSKAPCKESSLGSPHWLKLSLQGWLSRTVSTMMQRRLSERHHPWQ